MLVSPLGPVFIVFPQSKGYVLGSYAAVVNCISFHVEITAAVMLQAILGFLHDLRIYKTSE